LTRGEIGKEARRQEDSPAALKTPWRLSRLLIKEAGPPPARIWGWNKRAGQVGRDDPSTLNSDGYRQTRIFPYHPPQPYRRAGRLLRRLYVEIWRYLGYQHIVHQPKRRTTARYDGKDAKTTLAPGTLFCPRVSSNHLICTKYCTVRIVPTTEWENCNYQASKFQLRRLRGKGGHGGAHIPLFHHWRWRSITTFSSRKATVRRAAGKCCGTFGVHACEWAHWGWFAMANTGNI
jgi:hypothetical protein